MNASISAQELVSILGAYTALVLGCGGLLARYLRDIRAGTDAVNKAVNNRPADQPNLYEKVERLGHILDDFREDQKARHYENRGRLLELKDGLTEVSGRVDALERKR